MYKEVDDGVFHVHCGQCYFFDPNDVQGKPIGQIKIGADKQPVPLGYCRGPKGLTLQTRMAVQICDQPPLIAHMKKKHIRGILYSHGTKAINSPIE